MVSTNDYAPNGLEPASLVAGHIRRLAHQPLWNQMTDQTDQLQNPGSKLQKKTKGKRENK